MKSTAAAATLATVLLVAPCNDAAAQKIRRWVDDDGVVHYSEIVPPEFAHRDRAVLNEHGITVDFEQGEITDEERAEMARLADEEEARRVEAESVARRDQVLLDTYLSVAEIEALRDRRLELMESQIKVTEQYLGNLRKRLEALQREAGRLSQNDTSGAGLPAELALDISRTTASISLYEENLSRARVEQEALNERFAADIARFIELKGLDSDPTL
ncbi:MAG TPA: DUF4124 domain-containing protein [Gammaproteobacteria bacterium]|nr:DUF4124 domain-containing protein [Gammaproteobacteria bacterium]